MCIRDSECLAQLTVSNAYNNPFQFIYFEAVDIENGNNIYYFYDDVNMNLRDCLLYTSRTEPVYLLSEQPGPLP